MRVLIRENKGFQSIGDELPHDFSLIDLRKLIDGWNEPTKLILPMTEALCALVEGKKVLFVCHAGLSRSAGMCITLVAIMERRAWDEVHDEVKLIAPQINVEQGFRKACKATMTLLAKPIPRKEK
jgi:protein-tyrosine phosphatase